jgi:hypothetical protein
MRGAVVSGLSRAGRRGEAVVAGRLINIEGTGRNQIHTPAMFFFFFFVAAGSLDTPAMSCVLF